MQFDKPNAGQIEYPQLRSFNLKRWK